MLRHACGYALANRGHDTRALQAYLGHRNIQHTVRYTELSPTPFRDSPGGTCHKCRTGTELLFNSCPSCQFGLQLIFCGARQTAVRYLDVCELTYFEPVNDPRFVMPSSFEGTSGGGLWSFYVVEKDNKPEVIERRLIGVAFFQSPSSDGRLSITCHGSLGI
jgi:hypothetical protein